MKRKEWIEAAKIAISNPKAKIRCPNCGDAFLEIEEVEILELGKKDIHLICPNCGERNTVTTNLKKM